MEDARRTSKYWLNEIKRYLMIPLVACLHPYWGFYVGFFYILMVLIVWALGEKQLAWWIFVVVLVVEYVIAVLIGLVFAPAMRRD